MTDATERSCIRIKDVVTGFAIRKSLVTLASAAEWSRGDRSQTAVGERKKRGEDVETEKANNLLKKLHCEGQELGVL